MKYLRNEDTYEFSTGKRFYANAGLIGICPSGEVAEGYDGDVSTSSFTPDERRELADYMIALWQQFKDAAERGRK